jgi:peptidoglycan/xylan/chitin deacetylase (PgdA/CDA1 family)
MEQVRARFIVLSLPQAMAAIAGRLPLRRDACTITFDDGYADVHARALPILRELALPATVFVPTGYVGSARRLTHDRLYAALWRTRARGRKLAPALLPPALRALLAEAEAALARGGPAGGVDWLIARAPAAQLEELADALEEPGTTAGPDPGARVLDPAELRALAEAGWEIGGHTVEHVVLTHEPATRVREELARSRAAIERWTGRPCRYFAYCNGYHSPALVEALRATGYHGAVTTCDRPNLVGDDLMRVGRKVLWEAHARGPRGGWSPTLSAANLHDLFGALGLTTPVDGAVPQAEDKWSHAAHP